MAGELQSDIAHSFPRGRTNVATICLKVAVGNDFRRPSAVRDKISLAPCRMPTHRLTLFSWTGSQPAPYNNTVWLCGLTGSIGSIDQLLDVDKNQLIFLAYCCCCCAEQRQYFMNSTGDDGSILMFNVIFFRLIQIQTRTRKGTRESWFVRQRLSNPKTFTPLDTAWQSP